MDDNKDIDFEQKHEFDELDEFNHEEMPTSELGQQHIHDSSAAGRTQPEKATESHASPGKIAVQFHSAIVKLASEVHTKKQLEQSKVVYFVVTLFPPPHNFLKREVHVY